MVLDELIPMLSGQGLDTSRVGFLGWSMGGTMAYEMARQLSALGEPIGFLGILDQPADTRQSEAASATRATARSICSDL